MITAFFILAIIALILAVASAATGGRVPIWVAVILLATIATVAHVPKVLLKFVITLGFGLLVLSQLSACACSSAADRNSAACVIQSSIVDCTVDAVTSVVPQFLPVALELVSALTGGGGTLDWAALEKAFVGLGIRDGGCLLAEVQVALAGAGSQESATPIKVRMAASYVQGFVAYRAQRWPGIQFRLPGGRVL